MSGSGLLTPAFTIVVESGERDCYLFDYFAGIVYENMFILLLRETFLDFVVPQVL